MHLNDRIALHPTGSDCLDGATLIRLFLARKALWRWINGKTGNTFEDNLDAIIHLQQNNRRSKREIYLASSNHLSWPIWADRFRIHADL